jgi:oxygen-independent coproporphyrinogen III oxidase
VAGIYIHIPFCKQACHYCDFHFSTHPGLQNDFTSALLKEIQMRSSYLGSDTVETIYFGGGTPSLLPASSIRSILEAILDHFKMGDDPEITLEANPDDMQPALLREWKLMGINRLSVGIQSFFPEDLLWMNRAHTPEQAFYALESAGREGFDNISLDLIFGSPGLTDEKWGKNLQTAVSLDPAHLSCYALTVEPKTALFQMIRQKKTDNIQPEKQATQFNMGVKALESAGYEHYEISSFAKPGKRSRHNSAYWQSKRYLGLGPSAHSFDGHSRQWNVSNNAGYIKSINKGQISGESEVLRPADRLNEYIMTSLRTLEGLDLQYVGEEFGKEKEIRLKDHTAAYILSRQMIRENNKLLLTPEGKLFADGIAAALFFD